jgi:hypothetical protein
MLDQLHEEGELMKFVVGIPGFFCSTGFEEAASTLENAPTFSTLRANLYKCIAALFVLASEPVPYYCVT